MLRRILVLLQLTTASIPLNAMALAQQQPNATQAEALAADAHNNLISDHNNATNLLNVTSSAPMVPMESPHTSDENTPQKDQSATTQQTSTNENNKTHESMPSKSSFWGPVMLGAIGIVLVGAAVVFQHRGSASSGHLA